MIRINLIPHREAFRQQQIIELLIVFFATILLVAALLVATDVFSTQALTSLQSEKIGLMSQNKVLTRKIGELRNLDSLRKDVEDKLEIVDELQAGRFRSLDTIAAIVKAIPQNIWINTLKDKSGKISLEGHGEGSKAVANFMRALELSIYFDNVSLLFDKAANIDGLSVRSFSLTFRRLSLAEQEALIEAMQKGESK